MRGRSLVASLSLLAALTVGCAAKAPAPDPAADRAQLVRQADAWDQAIVRKDVAAISANMSEDFRQVRSNGDVADIVSPDLTIEPYTVDDLDVRLYGDVALLSGHTRMKGSYQGSPFATHYRYIDVYVRLEGSWQVASVQITTIPESPGAKD
jgi:ketosteroid isomerase-like protein